MMEFIQRILKNKGQYTIVFLLFFLMISCRNDYSSSNNERMLECILDRFVNNIPDADDEKHVVSIGETTGWTDTTSYLIIILNYQNTYKGDRLHAKYKGYDIYYRQGHMSSDSIGIVKVQDVEIDASKHIPNKLKWEKVTSPMLGQGDKLNYESHPFKVDLVYNQKTRCVEILGGSTADVKKSIQLNCNVCDDQ